MLTHFILDRSFLAWLTLDILILKLTQIKLNQILDQSFLLWPTLNIIVTNNMIDHLWVEVTVFCNPIPLRAWLQPIHILKEGLLRNPGMVVTIFAHQQIDANQNHQTITQQTDTRPASLLYSTKNGHNYYKLILREGL